MNDYLLNKLGIYFSILSKNFCEGIKINSFEKIIIWKIIIRRNYGIGKSF